MRKTIKNEVKIYKWVKLTSEQSSDLQKTDTIYLI